MMILHDHNQKVVIINRVNEHIIDVWRAVVRRCRFRQRWYTGPLPWEAGIAAIFHTLWIDRVAELVDRPRGRIRTCSASQPGIKIPVSTI